MKSCWERHLDLACTRLEQQTEINEKQQRKMVEQEKKMTELGEKLTEQGRVLEEAVKTIRYLDGFQSAATRTVYEGDLEGIHQSLLIGRRVSSASFYLRGYKMNLIIQRDARVPLMKISGKVAVFVGINVIVGEYDHLIKWPFRSRVMISFPGAKDRNREVSFEVCIASPSEDKEPRFVESGYLLRDLAPPYRFVVKLSGGE